MKLISLLLPLLLLAAGPGLRWASEHFDDWSSRFHQVGIFRRDWWGPEVERLGSPARVLAHQVSAGTAGLLSIHTDISWYSGYPIVARSFLPAFAAAGLGYLLGRGRRFEAVLLGREAMGEAARNARLRDNWRIRRGGRLIHAEATVLGGESAERDGVSLLAGALAFATVLHVSPHAERKLDAVRALLPESGGASLIGERLTVRLLAPSGLALRRSLAPIIALLSPAGSIPRLWTL